MLGIIHHHGSDAATEAATASTLRNLSHIVTLRVYQSRHVQKPMMNTAENQVSNLLTKFPRFRTYRM